MVRLGNRIPGGLRKRDLRVDLHEGSISGLVSQQRIHHQVDDLFEFETGLTDALGKVRIHRPETRQVAIGDSREDVFPVREVLVKRSG